MKTQHMEAAVATLDTLDRPAHSKGPESSNGVHTRNDLTHAERTCTPFVAYFCKIGLYGRILCLRPINFIHNYRLVLLSGDTHIQFHTFFKLLKLEW